MRRRLYQRVGGFDCGRIWGDTAGGGGQDVGWEGGSRAAEWVIQMKEEKNNTPLLTLTS